MPRIVKKVKTTRNPSDSAIPQRNTPAISKCDPEKGNACGTCKEGISMDRQILEMEEALSALKAMRIAHNTKVNTVHGSLSRLPVELVSNIFMCLPTHQMESSDPFFFGKGYDVAQNMKNLLLLGAVCSAWRSIAWSLPLLWTTISINIYDERENFPDMINQWLDRSGKLPLYLYLYTADRRLSNGGNERCIRRLMHPIKQCSERWFSLNLRLPKRFMHYVYCNELDTPMLETFTVSNEEDIDNSRIEFDNEDPAECIYVGGTPELRKVNLRYLAFGNVAIEWNSVTHVHAKVYGLSLARCSALLRAAPGLTHLTLQNLGDNSNELPLSSFRHPSLTCLRIDGFYWPGGADGFFPYFDLPALEDLSIIANRISRLDNLDIFLRQSSCTLKKFRLSISETGRWTENTGQLIGLLEKMPCLEMLELDCLYLIRYYSIKPVLVPPTIIQQIESIDERLFLPNLKKIDIKLEQSSWSSSLHLLLRPDDSKIISARQSSKNQTKRSGPLYVNPVFIYCLLDLNAQRTVQPIVESGYWPMPDSDDLHPFINFLRHSLNHYVYDKPAPW